MRYHTSLHKKLSPQVCCLYSHCWPRRCCSSGHYICCPVYLIEMRNTLGKCYKIYFNSLYVLENFKKYYFLLSQNVILLPKMDILFRAADVYVSSINCQFYKSQIMIQMIHKCINVYEWDLILICNSFCIIIFYNKLSQLRLTSFTAAISVSCLCSL